MCQRGDHDHEKFRDKRCDEPRLVLSLFGLLHLHGAGGGGIAAAPPLSPAPPRPEPTTSSNKARVQKYSRSNCSNIFLSNQETAGWWGGRGAAEAA